MARWFVLPLALLLAIAALLFFMANQQMADIDLYVVEFALPIGVLIPLTLFVGCLIAGCVLFVGVIVPQRLRLRAQTRALETRPPERPDDA
jgi:uncharacterized integral membrane protein